MNVLLMPMKTYLSIAAEITKPGRCVKYDGRSVPPPPRVTRSGVRVISTVGDLSEAVCGSR